MGPVQKLLVPVAILVLQFACKSEKPGLPEPVPISAAVALEEKTPTLEDETEAPTLEAIVVASARMSPARLNKNSGAQVVATCDDGIDLLYEWQVNGLSDGLQDSASFEGEFKRGDVVEAIVHPSRDGSSGTPYLLEAVTVQNSAPKFFGVNGKSFQLDKHIFPIEDPDGDVLRYSLEGAPEGLTVDEKSGVISFDVERVSQGDQGSYEVKLLAEDGFGGEVRVTFPVKVQK